MIQMAKDNWFLVLGAILCLGVVIYLIQYLVKQKQTLKELYEKRTRDQVLNEVLRNGLGKRNEFRLPNQITSVESGESDIRNEGEKKDLFAIKLTIAGKKTENYVLNPEEHILIGSDAAWNDIVLHGADIASRHGDIFSYKGQAYVKNLSSDKSLTLRRRNNQMEIKEKGVRILTGDWVFVGGFKIQITIVDYVGNKITE